MPAKTRKQKQRQYLILAGAVTLVVLLIAGTEANNILASSVLLPGYEGETNGLYGYQPNQENVAVLGDAISTPPGSCGYKWASSPTISAAQVTASTAETFFGALQPCALGTTQDTLNIEAQQHPIFQNSPQQVNYYLAVPGSTNQVKYVTGQVNNYTYSLTLQIMPSSSGGWAFSGDTVWYNLAAPDWNRAFPDPNNGSITGPVFEAPLYGVVTKVQWVNEADTTCSLCTVGNSLSFYSGPSTTGQTLVTLTSNAAPSSSLNSSISSQYSPDSRMQSLVYYPLTIFHMQNACSLGTCQAPQVTITIRLYTLLIGEYILTNPDRTQLQPPNNSQCGGFLCGVYSFLAAFGNFFNGIDSGLSSIATAVVGVMVVMLGYLAYSGYRSSKGRPT